MMGYFLANATAEEVLEELTPELMECKTYWHNWSPRTRGEKMGYILGKYGASVFYYVTMQRGVSAFTRLKRANMMAILERYSLSGKFHIIEESSKCASKNSPLLRKATSGSIVAQNPNVAYHVLQKKHRWNRFIHLTENPQEDFKKVVGFLEKHQILKGDCKLNFAGELVNTYLYSKTHG